MNIAIGIDLGTYNSTAAVAVGRKEAKMVESRMGPTRYGKNFPSFVFFDHNGKKQAVGKLAKAELAENPKLVIWGVKRLVGLSYETAKERGELERFQYDIERGQDGGILIKVGEERFTPSHILEYILREIKEDAENPRVNKEFGSKEERAVIEEAVISVPAYFLATRTAPIIEAARRAGFTKVDTIVEPTAAAVMYGLEIGKEANLLAFDLGAGTLDVTVLQVVLEGEELIPGELCTSGHEFLGGIEMDDMLISYLIKKYKLSGIEEDKRSMAMLKDEVEKAKIRLSTEITTRLELRTRQFVDLTRKELEDVLKPLLEKCRGPIRVALQQAGLSARELDHVLFVGGPTYMPCVRWTVEDELRRLGARDELIKEIDVLDEKGFPVDPMECVAKGASLKAGKRVKLIPPPIAEGYGTISGPVEGLPNYYASIIKENSHTPISGKVEISFGNPSLLEVPIPLVAKRPDPDKSISSIVYRYEYVGDFTLAITPTGELPLIDILLQVTEDKRLVATLVHPQTKEQVRFEGLNQLKGQEITLQEHTRPIWTKEIIEDIQDKVSRDRGQRRGWTNTHLEHYIHAAQTALTLVKDSTNPRVRRAISDVESAISEAVKTNNPGVCPRISNRTKELLSILSEPGINQITKEESMYYINQFIQGAK